jgi:hypothetical protein
MEQLSKLNDGRASLAQTQIEKLKMELAKAQSSTAIHWLLLLQPLY